MNENPTTATPNDTDPQGNGGKASEKLFTQEEVNRIVSERLARERAKGAEHPPEDEREKALREREAALQARENKLECMAYLREKGISEKYHADFEGLDMSDPEKFRKTVDAIGKHFVPVQKVVGADVANPPHTVEKRADFSAIFAPPKM